MAASDIGKPLRRPAVRIAVTAAAIMYLALIGLSPWGLWERDEGRYADVARSMLDRGDFITPRIDGAVFLDKPPLGMWVTAGSLLLWGRNEFGARFGQTVLALGLLLVTWRIGTLLFDRRRALAGVIVLASSCLFFVAAHILTLDLTLTFTVGLTLMLFLEGHRRHERDGRFYILMAGGAALAVLAKGPIGLVLPGMTVALFLTLRRSWGRIGRMRLGWGLLLFAAIAAPWYLMVSIRNPEFPAYFFLHENLARFATRTHHRAGVWYYYLPVVLAGLLPWSAIAAANLVATAVADSRAWLRRPRPPGEAAAFLLAWFIPGFLFFTLAQSKLPLYILPLFPAMAIACGAWLVGRLEAGPAFPWWISLAFVFTGAVALVAGGRLAGARLPAAMWEDGGAFLALAALVLIGLLTGDLLARRRLVTPALVATALLVSVAWYGALLAAGRNDALNETRAFARLLQREGSGAPEVYEYRCLLRGLPFYLGRTVGMVSPQDDDVELGKSYPHDPGSYVPPERLLERLRGQDRVFVVVRHKDLLPLQERLGAPVVVLARSSEHDLVSNR
jgi:4-amino-4-deoxy-L-arabinose transferase-like glycosyltransferase